MSGAHLPPTDWDAEAIVSALDGSTPTIIVPSLEAGNPTIEIGLPRAIVSGARCPGIAYVYIRDEDDDHAAVALSPDECDRFAAALVAQGAAARRGLP